MTGGERWSALLPSVGYGGRPRTAVQAIPRPRTKRPLNDAQPTALKSLSVPAHSAKPTSVDSQLQARRSLAGFCNAKRSEAVVRWFPSLVSEELFSVNRFAADTRHLQGRAHRLDHLRRANDVVMRREDIVDNFREQVCIDRAS